MNANNETKFDFYQFFYFITYKIRKGRVKIKCDKRYVGTDKTFAEKLQNGIKNAENKAEKFSYDFECR